MDRLCNLMEFDCIPLFIFSIYFTRGFHHHFITTHRNPSLYHLQVWKREGNHCWNPNVCHYHTLKYNYFVFNVCNMAGTELAQLVSH